MVEAVMVVLWIFVVVMVAEVKVIELNNRHLASCNLYLSRSLNKFTVTVIAR